ncbi:MAG: heavy metal translocating P-type ATPase [Thiotrichaceae bacterium]|nr:heavy metal translocating P-type ATPase [Thiotrichaceae bacterium]
MLLFGLEILAGTYIATELYHQLQKKEILIKNDDQHDIVKCQNTTALSKHTTQDSEVDQYLKISSISVGLFVVGYFIPPVKLLAIVAASYATVPILDNARQSIVNTELKNDLLIAIVSTGCFALGQFGTAGLAAWFYHLGDKMVEKTQNHSEEELSLIFGQQPKQVWLLKDKVEIEVSLEVVQVNDIIVVHTGSAIPIDGVIVKGTSTIDQHVLTGESMPVERGVGELVFASTLVLSGEIWVKVEHTGKDTNIAKISQILADSVEFKTGLQTRAEQWADNAAKPLLIVGGAFLPIVGAPAAMTILYSSPGSDIKVLASLQTLKHLSLAYQKGILVKDGRALETLLKVDTVLFDKTGTLTSDQPEVTELISCAGFTETEVLRYAAATEQKLGHPIARAIIDKANALELSLPKIENAHYQMGYGLSVEIEQQVVKVGSQRFMVMEDIEIPDIIQQMQAHCDTEGYSLVMLAVDEQIKGALKLQSQIRTEAQQVIHSLRDLGIEHIAIVSGDRQQPTEKLAHLLGMDNYYYDCLPQDKSKLIEELQQQGKTICFVGDGINDAIAMKTADVSISMLGATSIATDTAQIVLMDAGLSHLPYLFEISRQLDKKMKQTLLLCTTYGVSNFLGAAVFHFTILYSFVIGTVEYTVGVMNARNAKLD